MKNPKADDPTYITEAEAIEIIQRARLHLPPRPAPPTEPPPQPEPPKKCTKRQRAKRQGFHRYERVLMENCKESNMTRAEILFLFPDRTLDELRYLAELIGYRLP